LATDVLVHPAVCGHGHHDRPGLSRHLHHLDRLQYLLPIGTLYGHVENLRLLLLGNNRHGNVLRLLYLLLQLMGSVLRDQRWLLLLRMKETMLLLIPRGREGWIVREL
jgi:hypothetical protein